MLGRLGAFAYLFNALILVVIFHSMTEFMAISRDPIMWGVTAGIIVLTAVGEAFWTYTRWILIAVAAGSPLWLLLGFRYWPEAMDAAFSFLRGWFLFLHSAYYDELLYVPHYMGYFTLWLLLVAFTAWSLVQTRRNNPSLALLPGLGTLLFQWFFFFDGAEGYLPLYVVAAGLLVMTLQYRSWFNPQRLSVVQRFSLSSVVFSTVALLLLVTVTATLIPLDTPMWSMASIRRWVTSTFPVLDRVRGEGGTATRAATWFSLRLSGFGSPTELGGPLELDERPAFELSIRARFGDLENLNFPLYLKGRTLSQYTGYGWVSGEREAWIWYEDGQRLQRTVTTNVYTRQFIQTITPVHLETNTVFGAGDVRESQLPDEALEPSRLGGEVIAKSNYGDVISYNRLDRDGSYAVLSLMPYWELDPAEDRSSDPEDEDLIPYLQLPEIIPDRVHELAREITDGHEGNYARAQAVVRYLRDIPYSLEVDAIPEDHEFTDHFLFEGRAGYCTYHATALAVLLRSAGVPTRWVQGFVVPSAMMEPDPEAPDRIQQGVVPMSSAHAWVEVWLPNYGWVPFEATPAYPSVDHTAPAPVDPISGVTTEPADDEPGERPWLDFDVEEEWESEDEYAVEAPPGGISFWQIGTSIALIAAVGLSMISFALYTLVRRRDLRLARSATGAILGDPDITEGPDAQVIHAAILSLAYVSEAFNLSPRGLTLREFSTLVKSSSEEASSYLSELLGAYERVAYGRRSASDPEGDQAAHLYTQIMKTLRRQLGLRRYISRIYLRHLSGLGRYLGLET